MASTEVAMLVLSRHKDECIMIGEIKVVVVDIRGDKVRLGIDAPPEVPVHRREVYDAIKRQERQRGDDQGKTA
jgi:carbon storage regulator